MSTNKIKYLIWMPIFLAGLWFVACKTTPAPSTPVPPQPEANQTEDSTQSTSSPPAGSAQPEKQETANTSRTTSSEAAAAQTPESKQQIPDPQAAAESAVETQSQETAQRTMQSRETAPQTANAKLAKAREDLRISRATEKRIAGELETLKTSGNASAEDIRNYEAYLERVRAMVAENRRTVAKMESAYARHSSGKENAGEPPKVSDQQIPEEQVQDQVAELDRQLSASLSEFDALLLKEMETIETESNAKMRDLAQEAAEAARRLKEKGVELDGEESKSSDDASQQGKEDRQGEAGEKDVSREEKGAKAEQGEVDDAVASKDQTKGQGSGPKDDPGSRYNKEDDDIVARQLREAAENETDPELKEKLWKEYEDYRKNTQ
ncbi:MAG: hypothetical protein P8X80_11755 [Desulfobacterales bacterium]